MTEVRQHVILCEGFDDRSFWRGWLQRLGCTDPTNKGKRKVADVWGREVKGEGKYLFRTAAGSDVIVQPFHGRDQARKAVLNYVGGREVHPPTRLVLNLDSDSDAESSDDRAAEDQVRGIARELGAVESPDGTFEVGPTTLHAVIWRCDDPEPTRGVPKRQNLERLVAASIQAAHPGRGGAVDDWLAAAPLGDRVARSYAHSYYAKWYARHGAGNFYEDLWRDDAVAAELTARLDACGALAIVDKLIAE